MEISNHDLSILRALAGRVAEVAALPEQDRRRRLWHGINSLKPERPVVFASPEGSWEELLPQSSMQCRELLFREWERHLRMRLYAWDHFADDQVVDDTFAVPHVYTNTGWGLEPTRVYSDSERGAYYWHGAIKEESDLDKLRPPEVRVNWSATNERLDLARQVLGGILDVRLKSGFWWSVALIGELALLRGLEQMMVDMCERPQFVHRAMGILLQGRQQWLDDLEAQNLLSLNNGNDYVGSGGFGFTHELPAPDFDGKHVRTKDMWGFAEAQEITGVSPAMHDEFALQYQIPVLERFGLNCYGCCEPLHHKLQYVFKIPRLRRISISPWADIEIAAEALQDRYIFSWKPHPARIADVTFDADTVRADIRRTLEIARGCVVEMILKDTHTCNHQPERFDLWTQIAKEEAERVPA